MKIDHDELSELFKNDPERFEMKRRHIIYNEIDKMSQGDPKLRMRLYAIQDEIDNQLDQHEGEERLDQMKVDLKKQKPI